MFELVLFLAGIAIGASFVAWVKHAPGEIANVEAEIIQKAKDVVGKK